jgi:hypothetical protein
VKIPLEPSPPIPSQLPRVSTAKPVRQAKHSDRHNEGTDHASADHRRGPVNRKAARLITAQYPRERIRTPCLLRGHLPERIELTVAKPAASREPRSDPRLSPWPGRSSRASVTSGARSSQTGVPRRWLAETCSSSRTAMSAPSSADALSVELRALVGWSGGQRHPFPSWRVAGLPARVAGDLLRPDRAHPRRIARTAPAEWRRAGSAACQRPVNQSRLRGAMTDPRLRRLSRG